jgi:hypothetical protein
LVALSTLGAGYGANSYALFDVRDLIPNDGICGTPPPTVDTAQEAGSATCQPVGPFVARLGCDTDAAFVNNDPVRAQTFIEGKVNEINAFVYEPQLNTRHEIDRIIIRTPANDVYASVRETDGLRAIETEWSTNQADADVDLVVLWQLGLRFPSDDVGLANPGSMCNPGIAWVRGRGGNGGFNLLAHEIGHIWGANHCEDPPCCQDTPCYSCPEGVTCPIMRKTFSQCAGGSFNPCTVAQIVSDRRSYGCVLDLGAPLPQLALDQLVLEDGAVITFDETLTGQAQVMTFTIENRRSCMLPVRVSLEENEAAAFRISQAPTSLGPLETASFNVTLLATYADSYEGVLRVTTGNFITGLDLNVDLLGSVGVGDNFPTRPLLTCPPDQGFTNQPDLTVFVWEPASFVESYEFRVSSLPLCSDPPLFSEERLRQTDFSPNGLFLPPGSYCWTVIAHNKNGSRVSQSSSFTVAPQLTAPSVSVQYSGTPVVVGETTLNLPLNPGTTQFVIQVSNLGSDQLEISNVDGPRDFNFFGGAGILEVRPCRTISLLFTSSLTVADLSQTHVIADLLEFDTNDPTTPRVSIPICFRCLPTTCKGDPFSGYGLITSVTQGGCYHLLAGCGEAELIIEDASPFQVGDVVHATGVVRQGNENCLPFHTFPTIESPVLSRPPFSECGVVTSVTQGCYHFVSDAGIPYALDDIGANQLGDHVRVEGQVGRGTFCFPQTFVLGIRNATVTACQ